MKDNEFQEKIMSPPISKNRPRIIIMCCLFLLNCLLIFISSVPHHVTLLQRFGFANLDRYYMIPNLIWPWLSLGPFVILTGWVYAAVITWVMMAGIPRKWKIFWIGLYVLSLLCVWPLTLEQLEEMSPWSNIYAYCCI